MCFGLGSAVFSPALSAENTTIKKHRLRVVVDADGNVEITPTKTAARKSEKKIVITCERIRFSPPKKGHSSIEMIFIGTVRMVSGTSTMNAKRMTLSIPDGVRLLLKTAGVRGIER
jgi:hypothetical protein